MEGDKGGAGQMVAVDTGFFVALMRGHEQAKEILHNFKREKIRAIVSVLSMGELLYLLYREGRSGESAKIMNGITRTMKVVDVDFPIVEEGARIKQMKKMPYVDSLIGATAIVNGCKKLYTSDDKHMMALEDFNIDVSIIKE